MKWLQTPEELGYLYRARIRRGIDIREPLVLIAQIKRSGGNMLNQLFDGHAECHAHPSELEIGYPTRADWPLIELDAGAARWFELLYEKNVDEHLRRGYKKGGDRADAFPFLFLPGLQRAIFEDRVASRPIERDRDVLDCYFTSYFNAWLDNQNLYTGPKKVITAFEPRLDRGPANLDQFFAAYPDGLLITAVRDPRSWYASAHRMRSQEYRDLDRALELWRQSTEASLDAARRYGERVVLLTYEQLVLETEETMRRVAGRIGISMSPVLLVPTFNGRPIRANSRDAVERYGILPERVTAYRDVLDAGTLTRVEELAGDRYERAAQFAREQL
jgi:hypothetical protein